MGTSVYSNVSFVVESSFDKCLFLVSDEENRNPEGDFKINVLNTVVFLIQSSMTISTFAANYQGRPFMQNLNENKMMYRLIVGSLVVIFMAALNWLEPLTDLLELAPLPSEEFRTNLVFLMVVDLILVVGIERILSKVFAKNVDTHKSKLKLS
jgi:cation-transporting ATPase 13A1